ncbi:MAG: hypothetical protein NC311_18945 [Muribaculaceae bacterium]|nr:hypothetical protein [Muribaculaceae bacterium]
MKRTAGEEILIAAIKKQKQSIKLLRKLQKLGWTPKDKPLRMYIFTEESKQREYELKLKEIRRSKQ